MNTTNSYILGEESHDHLFQQVPGITKFTIVHIVDGQRKIYRTYTFNDQGKIDKIIGLPAGGWVAHPPLGPELKDESKKLVREIEQYIYSSNGHLIRIETFDEGESQPKLITQIGSNKELIETKSSKKSKILSFRDKKNYIEKIETTVAQDKYGTAQFITSFKRNDKDQIIEKNYEYNIIANYSKKNFSSIIEVLEEFQYNENNQLISSISKFEDDDVENIEKKIFSYLDDSSEFIKKIRFLENGLQKSSVEFTYNSKNVLIKKSTFDERLKLTGQTEYVVTE